MHHHSPLRRTALLGALLLGVAGCAVPGRETTPSYVVFFTAFSADLDEPARQVITQAAQAAQASGDRIVRVEGYADSAGSTEANRTLSRLRAQVVADALAERSVPRNRIVLRPRGQQDGDPGVESRRVEINITAP